MGDLWYVPAAIPLGSRIGLAVASIIFFEQTLGGSVEADRDGARDETLDTGAEADTRVSAVGSEVRKVCPSMSRDEVSFFNLLVAAESVQKRCSAPGMGSRSTSWTIAVALSASSILVC